MVTSIVQTSKQEVKTRQSLNKLCCRVKCLFSAERWATFEEARTFVWVDGDECEEISKPPNDSIADPPSVDADADDDWELADTHLPVLLRHGWIYGEIFRTLKRSALFKY